MITSVNVRNSTVLLVQMTKKKKGQHFSEVIAPFPLSHILNLNCLLVIGYIELSLAQNQRSLDFRH